LSVSTHAGRRGSGRIIQRYLLALTAKPFAATLLIVLPALLLERLLRLFDLIATEDVPAASVGRMLVDLVPHYLGLALPAALFIGIHFVIARLSAENQLEAMQNAGLSLLWISRPFILLGMVAAVGGFGLYGYVQPLSRYAYRAAYQAATQGTWNAVIPPGEIIRVSPNLIVSADRSDRATGLLSHVFVYQHEADGKEKVTTSRTGMLELSDDGTQVVLRLDNGEQMTVLPDNRIDTVTSTTTTMHHPFVLHIAGFRGRGADEREMTMGELWFARHHPNPPEPDRRLDGEFHGRLVRALSLAVLPLLAVSIGLAAKRARRQYGIAVGVVILVLYNQSIELAAALGTAGITDPRVPLWGAFLLFTVFCVWMFRRAGSHTSEGPFDGIFDFLERMTDGIQRGWRRLSPMRRRSLRPS
jgi:lipopolysaccharide export system permease protein